MDYIKLAQRTISMLSSMIESGECHTTRTREMVNNAQNGLEQLRQYNVVGRSEQLPCDECIDGQKWSPYYAKYVKCDCSK